MKKAPKGKWLIWYGTHDGTVANRDTHEETYNTETAARQGFKKIKSSNAGIGLKIWFADLYDDQGNKTQLASQNNPR